MSVPFIDLKSQYLALKSSIDQRIKSVLDHGAFVNGPEVAELEKKLCEFTGAPHSLACASGTDALVVPLMAYGIGPGDEVLTTTFSFIATAEAIALVGATPVFVDICPDTLNMDPKLAAQKINKKTKAIMPVSLYGQIADMDEFNSLGRDHGIPVIEDAAQSFGATYKGRRSCNVSHSAGTSFFPAKPLGCYGDGGAIFTADAKLHKTMKEIREHGSETRYYHTRLGINGRLDTLQCAILLAKFERYQWEIEQRQMVASVYSKELKGLESKGLLLPVVKADRDSVWAQYTVQVPNRESFQKKMNEMKVPTAVHYPRIMPDQPWYKEKFPQSASDTYKVSRLAAEKVVSLPLFPDMTEGQMGQVIQAVKNCL